MNWGELADRLRESGALSADWEETFRAVPRDRFTPARIHHGGEWIDSETSPARWAELADSDLPLVTQLYEGTEIPSSSSSMPTVVATMLRQLDVAEGMRVLEVGTGTGGRRACWPTDSALTTWSASRWIPGLPPRRGAGSARSGCGPEWWSVTACSATPPGRPSSGFT